MTRAYLLYLCVTRTAVCGISILAPASFLSPRPKVVEGISIEQSPSSLQNLPPSGGGPFASLPNYAVIACAEGHELRHWRQPDITFRVIESKNTKRTSEQTRLLAEQGIAIWKEKIQSKLKLRMAAGSDETADVEIGFVSSDELPARRVGDTKTHFINVAPPLNDLLHAEIRISDSLSSEETIQAIAHECGHALGIEGHSDGNTDLMYAFKHLPAKVTDRDANTLNFAYYQIDTRKKSKGLKPGQTEGTVMSY